jgi:hypothetical protein
MLYYSIAKAVGLLIQAVFDGYRVVFLLTIQCCNSWILTLVWSYVVVVIIIIIIIILDLFLS